MYPWVPYPRIPVLSYTKQCVVIQIHNIINHDIINNPQCGHLRQVAVEGDIKKAPSRRSKKIEPKVMAPKRKTTAGSKASKRPKTSSPSVNSAAAALSRDGSEHPTSEKDDNNVIDVDAVDANASNDESGEDEGSEDELGKFLCLWVFNG
jgi:hypothetical protein